MFDRKIKKVIHKLIDISQCGFIKKRNIVDGMRTVLDIIEEFDLKQKEGLMITIDFKKRLTPYLGNFFSQQ